MAVQLAHSTNVTENTTRFIQAWAEWLERDPKASEPLPYAFLSHIIVAPLT